MTEPQQPWRDTASAPAARVEALLAEMTLEEKLAQLGSSWVGADLVDPDEDEEQVSEGGNVAPMQDLFAQGAESFERGKKFGLGHLTRVHGTKPISAADGAARVVSLQQEIVDGSRLGVPAIVHEECLTGFTTLGATVYPAALAWGATFDPELVGEMATAIGRDMAAVGVHQGLSPVLDVVRDYRWGRVEETMGEDPYLVSMLGSAYVAGLESAGIVATCKHFAGYSASRGARNHAPVTIGPRELRDVILPSFEAAIKVGGARSVMNSYSDIDGVPAGADAGLLTTILRDEWGFTGTVVSDYWSVAFLKEMHRVADNLGQAGALALTAGIDVELPDTLCYGDELGDLVRNGAVSEDLVDRAARRVLLQKCALGLLDADWSPAASVAADVVDLDSPRNRQLARKIAERSVVLLSNDGILPLAPDVARVAVVGPCANDPLTMMGCYSFPNHVLPNYPQLGLGLSAPSVLESLRAELPGTEISFEPGVPVLDLDRSGIPAAVAAASGSDVVVVAVGDRAGLFGRGTSGEGCDAADLQLPGAQHDLVEALLDTGRPVVLLLVSGRPYALGAYADRAAAIVASFMPGEEGGSAVAGVLSGRVNPSGKLPVQVPVTPTGTAGTYLQPPLGSHSAGISNLDPTPLFGFGHGLSYTSFDYSDLELSATEVPTHGTVHVAVTVRNTGNRAGQEVVQLYLNDPVATVVRPLRQLVGFRRVDLEPGAAARVTFELAADRTAFTGLTMERIVEPGAVVLLAGGSVTDLPLSATVQLTGATRVVGPDRVLVTPATVQPL